MRLADGYRLLELDPAASDDEVKRAHRDLTQVWHPDRFGHDPRLRKKAEEKLKAINEAYETVLSSRGEGATGTRGDGVPGAKEPDGAWRVRRYRTRALLTAAAALFILFRRPTPAGLLVALGLFGLSLFFVTRMRAAGLAAQAPASRREAGP